MADTMREKLVELLYNADEKAYWDTSNIEFLGKIADHLIANGVTVQQWIPASEPPREDGTYIVKTARGTVTTARFYAFKSFPATKYLPACHRKATWQSNRNVTHWMPLPDQPQEKGAEENEKE